MSSRIAVTEYLPVQGPGFIEVTAEFARKKFDTVAKTIYVVIDSLRHAGVISKDNQVVTNVRNTSSSVKLFGTGIVEGIENFNTLLDKGKKFWQERTVKNAGHVGLWVNNMVNPVYDTTTLFNRVGLTNVSAETMRTFEGVNAVTLMVGMGYNAYEAASEIANSKLATTTNEVEKKYESHKVGLKLVALAKAICYVVLGALITLATFFSVMVPLTAILALSVTTIACTIFSFYYERLGHPWRQLTGVEKLQAAAMKGPQAARS